MNLEMSFTLLSIFTMKLVLFIIEFIYFRIEMFIRRNFLEDSIQSIKMDVTNLNYLAIFRKIED